MRAPSDSTGLWHDAVRALRVFALAPEALGGIRLRMPAGPARDALLGCLRESLGPGVTVRRLPPAISEEALTGGPDLSSSLASGKLVHNHGLLHAKGRLLLLIPTAERLDARIAGHLVRGLDEGAAASLACIALDEGREDEGPPAVLCERLALTLDLNGMECAADRPPIPEPPESLAHTSPMTRVSVPEDLREAVCVGAAALGIASFRAPLFALQFAKLSAAMEGRSVVEPDDVAFAARFVLGPRATAVPAPPLAQPENEPAPPEQAENDRSPGQGASNAQEPGEERGAAPDDLVVAAAAATLPALLLQGKALTARQGTSRNGKSGSGLVARRRGRPLGSRRGRLSDGRLDLLATLKAALPWQKLRAQAATSQRVAIRASDIHIRRYRERCESLTLFVVDASGSTAAQRLAEAKGAVELLLAECYVRRDQVGVISFRRTEATLILPPTRSLVRAKRLLAEMPGGGGTPLATAITAAADLASSAARNGLTPLIVFLTDGSANITRDGQPDRARAEADARDAARRAGSLGHRSLLIDVSTRERAATRAVAELMGARHIPLPRADARSLSRAVGAGARPG